MSKIKEVEIQNFWKDKNIKLFLNPDINFLIGSNGSGKTTIINILSSALRIEISSLIHFPFSEVNVFFDDESSIIVNKIKKEEGPEIIYKIKTKNQEKYTYKFNGYEVERMSRGIRNRYYYHNPIYYELKDRINQIVNLSWVSVNRDSILTEEPDSLETLSDTVLDQLSRNLTIYFSRLQNLSNKETEKFQKYVFSSLLEVIDNETKLSSSLFGNDDNIKKILSEIYEMFSIPNFEEKISFFYEGLKISQNKLNKDEKIGVKEFSFLFNQIRIMNIIHEWSESTKRQKKIFEKRDIFLDIIGSLYQHKSLILNNSNMLEVKGENNQKFNISYLSSGEKQLLIILGQALLKSKSEDNIYIADEPELSLHIEWQEKLVPSIRKLNPKSQIIFATHSPDIVGPFQDKTIRIDKIVYGE